MCVWLLTADYPYTEHSGWCSKYVDICYLLLTVFFSAICHLSLFCLINIATITLYACSSMISSLLLLLLPCDVQATGLNCATYAESWPILDEILQEKEQSSPVYMYCTGGIRCEKASVYLKAKGFQNVFQLQVWQCGDHENFSPSVLLRYHTKLSNVSSQNILFVLETFQQNLETNFTI